jgi:hypothetical protein
VLLVALGEGAAAGGRHRVRLLAGEFGWLLVGGELRAAAAAMWSNTARGGAGRGAGRC